MYIDSAEICNTANEIHPHPSRSQHTPERLAHRPRTHSMTDWHHPCLQTRRLSVNGHASQPACSQSPAPSKHRCAPGFHNCPSILARLAHGRAGSCTLGRTAAQYTSSAHAGAACIAFENVQKHRSACAHSLAPAELRLERVGRACRPSESCQVRRARYLANLGGEVCDM